MGMAASQARFLQLTARKNNDEYMGQQINQTRTALANKSAGLFEKMLALQPPVPPSSMDDKYYTQAYSFTDPRDEVRKKIVWSTFDNAGTTESMTIDTPNYIVGGVTTNTLALNVSTDIAALFEDLPVDTTSITGLKDPLPEGTAKTVLRYATFEHTAYDPDGNYHVYEEKVPIVGFFDNEERLLNFQELTVAATGFDPSYDPTSGTAPTSDDLIYSVTASTSPIDMSYQIMSDGTGYNQKDLSYNGDFDTVQFQQDMDRYEFLKNAYDYQIERINLETKQIQQEDKSLELKLKQIDTDHQAIQTEMEAVSKVIQKNIESTFKTFA